MFRIFLFVYYTTKYNDIENKCFLTIQLKTEPDLLHNHTLQQQGADIQQANNIIQNNKNQRFHLSTTTHHTVMYNQIIDKHHLLTQQKYQFNLFISPHYTAKHSHVADKHHLSIQLKSKVLLFHILIFHSNASLHSRQTLSLDTV